MMMMTTAWIYEVICRPVKRISAFRFRVRRTIHGRTCTPESPESPQSFSTAASLVAFKPRLVRTPYNIRGLSDLSVTPFEVGN